MVKVMTHKKTDAGKRYLLAGLSSEQAKQAGWLVISVPSRAVAMPQELSSLQDDAELALLENGFMSPCTASHACYVFAQLIERTRQHHYTADDLALALSEQTGESLDAMQAAIRDGYERGLLKFWRPSGRLAEPRHDDDFGAGRYLGLSGEYTTFDAINDWLEQRGDKCRLQEYKANPHGKKTARQIELILEAIRGLGHDPQNLPERKAGHDGIKRQVRAQLDGKEPFEKPSAFNTAWREAGLKS